MVGKKRSNGGKPASNIAFELHWKQERRAQLSWHKCKTLSVQAEDEYDSDYIFFILIYTLNVAYRIVFTLFSYLSEKLDTLLWDDITVILKRYPLPTVHIFKIPWSVTHFVPHAGKRSPAPVGYWFDSFLNFCLFTLAWFILNCWLMQSRWLFVRFIADQFIRLSGARPQGH